MPITDYVYSITADFPATGLYEDNFTAEIEASSIATAIVAMWRVGDVFTVRFADALSAGEKTTFDGDTTGPCGGLIAATIVTPPAQEARTTQIGTPATLTANKNNYGGQASAKYGVWRISSTLPVDITGIAYGVAGRLIRVHNVGEHTITLKDESASSLVGNRFALSMDLLIAPDEAVELQYDAISQRWRDLEVFPGMIGDAGAGGRKGMVPAPGVGDAAANKFLKADGTWAATPGGGGAPGGATTQAQYNNAGAFAGTAGLVIDAGGLPTVGELTTTDPAAPTTGATLFTRSRAGRRQIGQRGPAGGVYSFQPCLYGQKIGLWTAQGNGTVSSQINFGNSITGTASARTVATTNLATSLRRLAYVTSATAGNSAGTRHNLAQFYRGDAPGRGGFLYVVRFAVDTVASNMRWFVGLDDTIAVIGNVDPSTLTNIVGFGIDSGQTTVRFFHNDGSGTATAIDMGASFPATTAAVVYEVRVASLPNGSAIFYSIERLDSAAFTEGSINTDGPANTVLLAPQVWVNNGTTAAVAGLALVSQYTETDN